MSVWSTWIMYPSMAIFLRYAAMFRVGTSFIFSRIKSRSASVTLNLICTVLLRPSMLSLLSIPRVWDTSQQAIFNRRAAAQEGENTEVGTRFLCLLRMFFLNPYYNGKPRFAKLTQKKNAAISKRLQRFLKSIFNFAGRFYLSSFSTSEISFAVAVTIRMPLSLISSRRASSCRRFVSFPAGVSKRNWSTDIL